MHAVWIRCESGMSQSRQTVAQRYLPIGPLAGYRSHVEISLTAGVRCLCFFISKLLACWLMKVTGEGCPGFTQSPPGGSCLCLPPWCEPQPAGLMVVSHSKEHTTTNLTTVNPTVLSPTCLNTTSVFVLHPIYYRSRDHHRHQWVDQCLHFTFLCGSSGVVGSIGG